MDLRPHLDMGRLQVHQFTPAELSPGQFVHYVRRAVETDGVRAVLIDSLNNYLNAMPNEEYLIIQMHELLSYLNQHGIVTLLVLGQHGLVGDLRADVDLSYLSDTIILMRYFEVAGAVRRVPVGGEDSHLGPRAHHPRVQPGSRRRDDRGRPESVRRSPRRLARMPWRHRRLDGDDATGPGSAGRLRPMWRRRRNSTFSYQRHAVGTQYWPPGYSAEPG